MTNSEEKLLIKAVSIMDVLERAGFNPRLSGSLMLSVIGVKKSREASDIDIIIDKGVMESRSDVQSVRFYASFFLTVFKNALIDAGIYSYGKTSNMNESDTYGLSFIIDGVKADIIPSYEIESETINGIKCASLFGLLSAKYKFSVDDKSPESKAKHRNDVGYIMSNNTFGFDMYDLAAEYFLQHTPNDRAISNIDDIKAL